MADEGSLDLLRNFGLVREPQSISPLDIQSDIDAIKALPFEGIGIISGNRRHGSYFSKLQRLDVAPNSRLVFDINLNCKSIYFVAKEVYIQNPDDLTNVSKISYALSDILNGITPPKSKDGRTWRKDWWDDNGQNGGDGDNGLPGPAGMTFDAPRVFLVFQTLTIQGGNPRTSSILNFEFDGLRGGDGANGGAGGNGGRGATGTHAVDKWTLGVPTCKAGPGRGGDSGKPGSGGRGGDAGRGGNGSDIFIVCPESEAAKVAFQASNLPGEGGTPGQPGAAGAVGEAGSGGNLSTACRGGRPGGNVIQATPRDFGPGSPSVAGKSGSYGVVYRDNSDIFPF